MGVTERDRHTGHATTGHEWDGIRELNTAVPRPVWLFLIATALFSAIYWVLMPAWPLGRTYTKGLLGADVRKEAVAELSAAAANRAWALRIEREDFAAIQADKTLMKAVRETGPALYGDNCAICHGTRATGGPGFPSLVDAAWLWGDAPEQVFETIAVGVNSGHPETRSSQMLAFGRDGILDRQAILDVAAYVQSLAVPASAAPPDAPRVRSGQEIFAANCSGCHGDEAKGSPGTGAPDLTDGFWLYGGDLDSIVRTIQDGRQGHMPSWEKRLTAAERKILTLYLLDLGNGSGAR